MTVTPKPPPLAAGRLVPGDVVQIEADQTATVYRVQVGGVWVFKVALDLDVKPMAALPVSNRN